MSLNDPEIERRFVDTSLGQFHLRCSRGSERVDALPLIMLHASPASSLTLVPLIKGIGKNRRCFAPDTLSFGDSAPPPLNEPEIEDYAVWVMQAIDALGIEKFHLYGSHTGAHIAVEAAIQQPDRLERLVLDGIAMFTPEEKCDVLENYAPEIVPDVIGSQFNWAWHFIRDQVLYFPYYHRDTAHSRGSDMAKPEMLHDLTVDVLKAVQTYHRGYRAAFRHDDRARLPLLKHPTLVMADRSDPLHGGVEVAASLVADSTQWISPVSSEPGAMETKVAGIEAFLNGGSPA